MNLSVECMMRKWPKMRWMMRSAHQAAYTLPFKFFTAPVGRAAAHQATAAARQEDARGRRCGRLLVLVLLLAPNQISGASGWMREKQRTVQR